MLTAALVAKTPRMTGSELRFLRGRLRLSAVALASQMGVTSVTVSRWENGHEPIGPVADRLLRMMVLHADRRHVSLEVLATITREAEPLTLRVVRGPDGWQIAPPRRR